MNLQRQLNQIGISVITYLNRVRLAAYHSGYDPYRVYISDDGIHKLYYLTPDNHKVYFGRIEYNDFHIYKILEERGERESHTAYMRRHLYLRRATRIKGSWKFNRYSPNNLAIRILWNE
jgi:hypothetical protein